MFSMFTNKVQMGKFGSSHGRSLRQKEMRRDLKGEALFRVRIGLQEERLKFDSGRDLEQKKEDGLKVENLVFHC